MNACEVERVKVIVAHVFFAVVIFIINEIILKQTIVARVAL